MLQKIRSFLRGASAVKGAGHQAGRYFVSSREESLERIRKLGLDKGSEDVSGILDGGRLVYPRAAFADAADAAGAAGTAAVVVGPNAELEWIIDIRPVKDVLFDKAALLQVFNERWRGEKAAVVFYGHSWEQGVWGYVFADGSPGTYDRLSVGVRFRQAFSQEPYEILVLLRYLSELQNRLGAYPGKVVIEPRETAGVALERAKKLAQWKSQYGKDMLVVLKREERPADDDGNAWPAYYDGRQVWDALVSLGLRWGDGDLFHWDNVYTGYGNIQLFSVWTASPPGYFFPEAVAGGRFFPGDLVFGFWIARSVDPVSVYAVMLEAVRYCQQRLGGVLLDRTGAALDIEKERGGLQELVRGMREQGLEPGSDLAMQIF